MSMRVSTTSLELGKGYTLVGRSRAGDGTSFAIPEWKWLFDCGAPIGVCPHHIFLTHTHADHIAFLTNYLNLGMNNSSSSTRVPPTLYLPAEALPYIQAYLRAHHALVELSSNYDDDDDDEEDDGGKNPQSSYHLRPLAPDNEFTVKQRGGDELVVVPILAEHRITCYGYSISRTKKLLKDEYAGLRGHEIGKLRKQGIGVFQSVREPLFCYIGDTTPKVFENYPKLLRQHRVIVTECSFITSKDVARAEETKHTNWVHLKPFVEAHPQTLFVLIHFSLKHSALTLLDFFNKESAQHRNVHPMLMDDEIHREWIQRNGGGPRQKQPPRCRCFQCVPNANL